MHHMYVHTYVAALNFNILLDLSFSITPVRLVVEWPAAAEYIIYRVAEYGVVPTFNVASEMQVFKDHVVCSLILHPFFKVGRYRAKP